LWYRAPEILFGNHNYTFAADYWSIGIIAYEMIYLQHRFPGTSEIDMLFKIFEQKGTPSFARSSFDLFDDPKNGLPHLSDYDTINPSFIVNFPKFPRR